jgi:prevent-host-death family protein
MGMENAKARVGKKTRRLSENRKPTTEKPFRPDFPLIFVTRTNKAQKEPIGTNKNGRPVAVMVSASEYEELQFLKEQWLKLELQKGLDDLQAGRIKNGQDVMDR